MGAWALGAFCEGRRFLAQGGREQAPVSTPKTSLKTNRNKTQIPIRKGKKKKSHSDGREKEMVTEKDQGENEEKGEKRTEKIEGDVIPSRKRRRTHAREVFFLSYPSIFRDLLRTEENQLEKKRFLLASLLCTSNFQHPTFLT